MKNYEFLNPSFMNQDEINFILLEPSIDEIYSPKLKRGVRSEVVDILKNDLSGTLLLPFNKE